MLEQTTTRHTVQLREIFSQAGRIYGAELERSAFLQSIAPVFERLTLLYSRFYLHHPTTDLEIAATVGSGIAQLNETNSDG